MKFNYFLMVLGAIIIASASGLTGYYALKNFVQNQVVNVTKIIDGDTIEIETGERVRLLGINAPETNEHYYKEAKEELSKLVENKKIVLKAGAENKDQYGRLLRYIFINKTFVNLEMVKEGYATVYLLTPDDKHYSEFKNAEKHAKESNLFIWSASNYSMCIGITEFHYTDDEYVKLNNGCDYSIKMENWEIKDEGTHIYIFKAFVFKPNSNLTFFTGFGDDTSDKLYWNSKSTIWNNDGDTLFLRDDKGNLVISYKYP